MSRSVLIQSRLCTKAREPFDAHTEFKIKKKKTHGFVGRGGLKLAAALDYWNIQLEGKRCLDVGSSTGGFCDVLLKRGAQIVYASDVGKNLLDWQIRKNPKVTVLEGIHAKKLSLDEHLGGEPVDFITVDLSFISLKKVLGSLVRLGERNALWVMLIKPQFELEPKHIPKGGVVVDRQLQDKACQEVQGFAESLGLKSLGLIESPIKGTRGNREFLFHGIQS